MSAEAVGWVFRHSPATGAALNVHLAIADSVNDQNAYEFWMRVPRLAQKARVHPGSVRRALADLIAAGMLEELHDGRTTDDAASATEARRFRFLMPSDEPPVWDPAPPKVRAPRAGGAGTRAGGASTRAHGAGHLEPKVKPKENPTTNPPNPPEPLTLLPAPSHPAVPPQRHSSHDLPFAAFWEAYPRRVAKGAARKAWDRALRRADGDAAAIVAGARRYADDPNRPAEYTAHPATWLNADRWLDEEPLPERTDGMNRTERALRRARVLHSGEPYMDSGPRPLSIAAHVFNLAQEPSR